MEGSSTMALMQLALSAEGRCARGLGFRLAQVRPPLVFGPWARVRRPVLGEKSVGVGPKKRRVDGARGPSERPEECVLAGEGRCLGPAEEPLGVKAQLLDAHRELADGVELFNPSPTRVGGGRRLWCRRASV